jgi:hypothetical protein
MGLVAKRLKHIPLRPIWLRASQAWSESCGTTKRGKQHDAGRRDETGRHDAVARIPSRFQRRGGRKRIVAPDGSEIAPSTMLEPDGSLVKALVRAWRWQRMLDEGVYTSVSEIGDAENISKSYVSRILRLALLAADVVEGMVAGTADQALVLDRLERQLPTSWEEQRDLFLSSEVTEDAGRLPNAGPRISTAQPAV